MTNDNGFASSRFTGFAKDYDEFRPRPPSDLFELILGLSPTSPPDFVIDLGCGTGISTRPWALYANKVVGIDSSEDMLCEAEKKTNHENIEYRYGTGTNTGIENSSADVVTCSSAIHWMPPVPTSEEISNILKQRGVFIAYGWYSPVIAASYHLTEEYAIWKENLVQIEKQYCGQNIDKWTFSDIVDVYAKSECFKYVRRMYLHSKELWDAKQFIGFINTHAGIKTLCQANFTVSDLGVDRLVDLVIDVFSDRVLPVYFTYSLFYAICDKEQLGV